MVEGMADGVSMEMCGFDASSVVTGLERRGTQSAALDAGGSTGIMERGGNILLNEHVEFVKKGTTHLI